MRQDEALRRLRASAPALAGLAVRRLAIFGSVARDEAREDSDVDVLVEFNAGAHVGLFAFVRLQRFLSQILEQPVDLATPDALRPEWRDKILAEAIDAV